jgi:hypothetical protein
MDTEHHDRHHGPGDPRPHGRPARRLGGFQVEAHLGRPARPLDGNVDRVPARLGQLENGGAKQLVGRRLGGGGVPDRFRRIFQRDHPDGHAGLGDHFAGGGVLDEDANVHRPGPEGGRGGENGDAVAALPLR